MHACKVSMSCGMHAQKNSEKFNVIELKGANLRALDLLVMRTK